MVNKTISSFEWANERGKQWQAQYERMEAMLSPVDEPLLRTLMLDQPYHIADIGCGAGGTTFNICKQAPLESVVDGFDISQELITSAQSRVISRPVLPTFRVLNVATEIPSKAQYDRLLSRFGVMFFDEPLVAFTNLKEWLKPNGRFSFAVWGPVVENSWILNVREAISQVVSLPVPDIEAPGPFRYANVDTFLSLLSRAGFKNLETQKWQGLLSVGGGLNAHDAAKFSLSAFSIGDVLAAESAHTKNKAHQILGDIYLRSINNGIVQDRASVWIVSGVR